MEACFNHRQFTTTNRGLSIVMRNDFLALEGRWKSIVEFLRLSIVRTGEIKDVLHRSYFYLIPFNARLARRRLLRLMFSFSGRGWGSI